MNPLFRKYSKLVGGPSDEDDDEDDVDDDVDDDVGDDDRDDDDEVVVVISLDNNRE